MFCSNCGKQVVDGTKFCPMCGALINAGTQAAADPVSGDNAQQYADDVPQPTDVVPQPGVAQDSTYHQNNAVMDAKATSIVAYMTWIGFIVAMCLGDREGAKFYLNQALVFNLFAMLGIIPIIGWLWEIFMLVCFIFGVIWAAEQQERELPLIGAIRLI